MMGGVDWVPQKNNARGEVEIPGRATQGLGGDQGTHLNFSSHPVFVVVDKIEEDTQKFSLRDQPLAGHGDRGPST